MLRVFCSIYPTSTEVPADYAIVIGCPINHFNRTLTVSVLVAVNLNRPEKPIPTLTLPSRLLAFAMAQPTRDYIPAGACFPPYPGNIPMIKLSGSIIIKQLSGKNGSFSVGELLTEIGTFKVKDTILDQYEEGRYSGDFLIQSIFPSSYIARGRVITEVRATIQSMFINDENTPDESRPPQASPAPLPSEAEPDPLDEAPQQKPEAHHEPQPSRTEAAPETPSATPVDVSPAPADDNNADEALFQDLYPLVAAKKPVKLDPTVDRLAFRQQRDRLRALGYTFRAQSQTWEVA